jgi:hypothetical protein
MALLHVMIIRPLIAAEASHFVLIQNWRKNQVSRNASCAQGHCAANPAEPGLQIFCAASPAHCLPFCKILLCPAFALMACIVLPDFGRSCSTDGVCVRDFRLHHFPNLSLREAKRWVVCLGATWQFRSYAGQLGQGLLL